MLPSGADGKSGHGKRSFQVAMSRGVYPNRHRAMSVGEHCGLRRGGWRCPWERGQPSGGGRGPEELWKQSSDRGLPRSEERACAGKLKAEFLPSVEDPKGAWPQQLRGMGGWPGVHCPVMDSETFSLVKGTRQNLLRLLYRTGLKQFGMSPVVGK